MEEPSPGAGLDDEVTLKTFGKADMFVLSKHFKPKQKKTSIYTGVTYHKTACKWEAHLWDATIVRQDCIRTGTQIYLGAWETERRAAMAYDLLAIKYWGADTKKVNFESSSYQQDSQLLRGMSKTDATKTIRRHAPSFNSGNCNFRGVTRAPKLGVYKARIGKRAGEHKCLGHFRSAKAAAQAYDAHALKTRGKRAVTNFCSNSSPSDNSSSAAPSAIRVQPPIAPPDNLTHGATLIPSAPSAVQHCFGAICLPGFTPVLAVPAISAQPFQHNAGLVWSLQLCTKAASSQMGEYISSGRVAYKLGDDGSGTMPLEPCSPGRMFDADHSNKYIRALMYAQLSC
ncbi:hypothetical protein WJX73_009111 [Symbiochloris irregularis]|uniref:AP2/ERF domain-containing protein n=1 Tax=Symbiochloris irregularis TaxID=706552 RepID=A0AAW1PTY1_9CHLO